MSYKCMILTAIIIFPTFSGSLIYIWISKDLYTIFNFKKSHEVIILKYIRHKFIKESTHFSV